MYGLATVCGVYSHLACLILIVASMWAVGWKRFGVWEFELKTLGAGLATIAPANHFFIEMVDPHHSSDLAPHRLL